MLMLFKTHIIRNICMYLHKCVCFSSYLTFNLLHFLSLQTLHPHHLETKEAETKLNILLHNYTLGFFMNYETFIQLKYKNTNFNLQDHHPHLMVILEMI